MPIKPAFSAVELLLVAGITAILVAIAVPGYLDAKVRAEVVDVRTTLRTVNNALIQYQIDTNEFPEPPSIANPQPLQRLITTGLLNRQPVDRFKEGLRGLGSFYADPFIAFDYIDSKHASLHRFMARRINTSNRYYASSYLSSQSYWYLKSIGPDQTDYRDEGLNRLSNRRNELGIVEYNPTNGIFSLGEIVRSQVDNY